MDSPPPAREPAYGWLGRFAGYDVYANPSTVPRAYTVSHARLVADEQEALATILGDEFAPRYEAVMLSTSASDDASVLAVGPRLPLEPARITRDVSERVDVEFNVTSPSLLVLADAFAPGWRVTVDGSPRPLRQVNYHLRGVLVGPGDHRAEFSYRAPGFLGGVALAGSAWCAVLFLGVLRVLRSRSAPAATTQSPR